MPCAHSKLAFEHEEELLQDIWELEQEVKELKAGGQEKRIAELEAELKKEREARKLADAAAGEEWALGLGWAMLKGRAHSWDIHAGLPFGLHALHAAKK